MSKQELKLKEIEQELKELPFKLYIAHQFLKQTIKQGIRKSIDIDSYFKT